MRILWLVALASSAALGQNVYNTGHAVVGGPAGTSSVTGGACPTGQVVSALSVAGVPTCVASGAGLPDPGANGLVTRTGTNASGTATQATVLGVISDAVPISPVGKETSGMSNGVQNTFTSPTYCSATLGCVVRMPPSYASGSVGGYGPFGWHTGFSNPAQLFYSDKGGQTKIWHYNPVAIGEVSNSEKVVGIDNETQWVNFDGYDHAGFNNVLIDSSPGINNGTIPVTIGKAGWTTRFGAVQNLLFQGAGIRAGFDQTLNCPGVGDCHGGYWYIGTYGGYLTPSDEATQGLGISVSDIQSQYRGTITGVTGNLVSTSLASGSLADVGQGRLAVDTTASSKIASVTVVGKSSFYDTAGGPYETFTIAGASLTPSAFSGTLDAAIDPPTVPLTYLGTSVTFGITQTGGSGAPTVGQYINLPQPFFETVKITGVTSPSTNHYQVTAYVRRYHSAAQYIYESVYGRAGWSFAANTSTLAGDSAGMPFFYNILGQTDATHVVVTMNQQGHLDPIEGNNFLGNVILGTINVDSMTNPSGVATILFYDNNNANDPRKFKYPTVTIANSTNTAFNGQCTNVRNFHFNAQGKWSLDCDQSSSTGQSQPYSGTQTPLLSFGATGFGNTTANIYPAAEILDVNTYPATGCYASGGGTSCQAYVGGQLRLEPNAMPMPTGGQILVAHDVAELVDGVDIYHTLSNPSSLGNVMNIAISGPGVNSNRSIILATNGNASSNYVGFGGDWTVTHGFRLRGLFQEGLALNTAPPQSGTVIDVGCPASPFGCSDVNYLYPALRAAMNNTSALINVQPGLNTVHFASNVGTISTWDFQGILRTQGPVQLAVGSSIASASTISPGTPIVHVTGTTAINTITPSGACSATSPANFAQQGGVSYGCQITIIPDGLWTTTTAGNIALASTAVVSRALVMTFDTTTSKWYPSY